MITSNISVVESLRKAIGRKGNLRIAEQNKTDSKNARWVLRDDQTCYDSRMHEEMYNMSCSQVNFNKQAAINPTPTLESSRKLIMITLK